MGATYAGTVIFLFFLFFLFLIFVFIFFNRATAHTGEPIFAHNSSEDAVWCKKDPFGMKNV